MLFGLEMIVLKFKLILSDMIILQINTIESARQTNTSFDPLWLQDLYEKVILETIANKITPLVVNPGTVLLSAAMLYFQPFNRIEPVGLQSL